MLISHFLKKVAILLSAILLVILFQRVASLNRIYTQHIYPFIQKVLNGFSSIFPFSLYDVFIVVAIVALLVGIVCLFRHETRKLAFQSIILGLGWIYVAFYMVWGINYFSPGFLQRNKMEAPQFNEAEFKILLNNYVDSLNANFTSIPNYTEHQLDNLIRNSEKQVRETWNFPSLPTTASAKSMLFGRIYAAMGIRGYYGPFFGEAHVNPYYLPHERAAVTAHELGHLAGITSEAEANLYAYLITTNSDNQAVRFSGYYSVLPYMLSNAYRTLPEQEYNEWVERINPRIRALYRESRQHWQELYSQRLGAIQSYLYELYLTNNNIPTGQANYSEVVGLLMALQQRGKQ